MHGRLSRPELTLHLLTEKGASYASVAFKLQVSERTVKRDIAAIYQRTGTDTLLQAAAALGWINKAA
jgi:DNA-binding NarL/FixJ family response regulator